MKCNHDKMLIRAILDCGQKFGFGLEVGSKAELIMAMSLLCQYPPGSLMVCNGYKDAEYMELVGKINPQRQPWSMNYWLSSCLLAV